MKTSIAFLGFVFQLFNSSFSQYFVEEVTVKGSCVSYVVKDLSGTVVLLPTQAALAISCSPNTPLVSTGTGILFYYFENAVYSLEIPSGKTQPITKINKTANGISDFILNENQNSLAFVTIVLDSNLNAITYLAIISLQGPIKKFEWNQELKLNYFCDGNCTSIAGRDFWFEEDNTIGYFVWNQKPYDNEGAGKEKFWKLY